jgi:hypothetical protein
MVDKTFILKNNSEEIRKKITDAGISVCFCASFVDADWLDYSTAVGNGVHGNGYPCEGMTKEETRALFLHEVKNPIWCNDVEEFIKLIKEFEDGKIER